MKRRVELPAFQANGLQKCSSITARVAVSSCLTDLPVPRYYNSFQPPVHFRSIFIRHAA